jgi:hypothetical protein
VLLVLIPVLNEKQAAAAEEYEVTMVVTFFKMMDCSSYFLLINKNKR